MSSHFVTCEGGPDASTLSEVHAFVTLVEHDFQQRPNSGCFSKPVEIITQVADLLELVDDGLSSGTLSSDQGTDDILAYMKSVEEGASLGANDFHPATPPHSPPTPLFHPRRRRSSNIHLLPLRGPHRPSPNLSRIRDHRSYSRRMQPMPPIPGEPCSPTWISRPSLKASLQRGVHNAHGSSLQWSRRSSRRDKEPPKASIKGPNGLAAVLPDLCPRLLSGKVNIGFGPRAQRPLPAPIPRSPALFLPTHRLSQGDPFIGGRHNTEFSCPPPPPRLLSPSCDTALEREASARPSSPTPSSRSHQRDCQTLGFPGGASTLYRSYRPPAPLLSTQAQTPPSPHLCTLKSGALEEAIGQFLHHGGTPFHTHEYHALEHPPKSTSPFPVPTQESVFFPPAETASLLNAPPHDAGPGFFDEDDALFNPEGRERRSVELTPSNPELEPWLKRPKNPAPPTSSRASSPYPRRDDMNWSGMPSGFRGIKTPPPGGFVKLRKGVQKLGSLFRRDKDNSRVGGRTMGDSPIVDYLFLVHHEGMHKFFPYVMGGSAKQSMPCCVAARKIRAALGEDDLRDLLDHLYPSLLVVVARLCNHRYRELEIGAFLRWLNGGSLVGLPQANPVLLSLVVLDLDTSFSFAPYVLFQTNIWVVCMSMRVWIAVMKTERALQANSETSRATSQELRNIKATEACVFVEGERSANHVETVGLREQGGATTSMEMKPIHKNEISAHAALGEEVEELSTGDSFTRTVAQFGEDVHVPAKVKSYGDPDVSSSRSHRVGLESDERGSDASEDKKVSQRCCPQNGLLRRPLLAREGTISWRTKAINGAYFAGCQNEMFRPLAYDFF
ncbi:hypothetical protein FA13DRAFT_1709043 [Coprinellus micaceus]|uniref:Uncharacterized protein n=1 Tax=Coprinellus micaceus TaxID=71717 RepID=A0A4Y7TER9_COPMI|nr:hypothetical protein FA13DRAFT_1709043 [Coprinellus micaceus]